MTTEPIENAPPSVDPANRDSLAGMLSTIFNKLLQGMDVALPAEVISARRGPPTMAQVRPLIKMVATTGASLSRAPIASVPVYQFGGGDTVLTLPVKPGDMGLLIAMDRDISLFLQSGGESVPNTYRKRDFSSSFFLPMVRNYTLNGEDSDSAVLQTVDGSVAVSVSASGIVLRGPVTIKDDLLVEGNIYGGANITATGTITPGTPPP